MSIAIYTLKQTAEILKMTERTVFSYIHSGKLKASKIGGQWRIREADIDEFVLQHRFEADTQTPENNV